MGVALDSSGKAYVADTSNYRIQVFSQGSHDVPLSVDLRRAAACTDISATLRGISVEFTIAGLYHLVTTYNFEVHDPSGNIVVDESWSACGLRFNNSR